MNIEDINKEMDESLIEMNRMRALWHYYKKVIPRTKLSDARMKICKEQHDKISERRSVLIYQRNILLFLKDHPEYYDELKSEIENDFNPLDSKNIL